MAKIPGWIIQVILLLFLSACSDEGAEQSSEIREEAPAKESILEDEADKTDLAEPVFEELNQTVRVIGDGTIAAPRIESEFLERVAPIQNSEKKNAAQMARIPEKPTEFPRPLVLSAGLLQSKNVSIRLTGITFPEQDHTCRASTGEWPCGNFAKAALQRLIRSRTIACDGEYVTADQFEGTCRVGSVALNSWLAEQGWALAAKGDLGELVEGAKQANRGLWRK